MQTKLMLNQRKLRCFIHQEIRITDNKIVIEDSSVEITRILKIKKNKKMSQFNNKGEISRCNFYGSKFHWEKPVQMAQKNIMIYDDMNN